MGYAVYEDRDARDMGVERWAGYGVPALCDHPDCDQQIDRGLDFKCEEWIEYGEDPEDADGDQYEMEREGCGLYFCPKHSDHLEHGDEITPKPDTAEWVEHMLTDETWQRWRDENPDTVKRLLETTT